MKYRIDQTAFDALSEDLKALYKKQDDGSYQLQVEGMEDTGALKRAKDHEKTKRQEAETRARELEARVTELEAASDDKSKQKGDVDALNKSWEAKLAKREKELSDKIAAREKQLTGLLVDNEALGLAQKISTSPNLILPHIRQRFKAEEVDGNLVVRILDKDGNVSASTQKDLEEEFVANPDFAAIIVGSRASGSGAQGGQRGGGAKAFHEMSEAEKTALYKASPERYEALKKQSEGQPPRRM
jgi:hypothetical protein